MALQKGIFASGIFFRGVRLEQNKEPAYSREIKQYPFPDGKAIPELPIEGEEGFVPVQDPSSLTGKQVIRLARLAGIIDENDGCLLWQKLEEAKNNGVFAVVVALFVTRENDGMLNS